MANNTFFENLEKIGISVDEGQKNMIVKKVEEMVSHVPTIGIFGKTGTGKSSLCNALFGEEICEISDVEACTREPQRELVKIAEGKYIRIVDVPGASESTERDKEYADLYVKLLPELDALIWLIKADDRALASDENFYKSILSPFIQKGMPYLFVINQVDKVEPFREWDDEAHIPGPKQFANIEKKKEIVQNFFGVPASKVIAISANERYNLVNLVNELIYALPNEKKMNVYAGISEEFRSEELDAFVQESTDLGIADIIKDVIPTVYTIKDIYDVVKESGAAKALWEGVKTVGKAIAKGIAWIASFFS